MLYHRTFLIHNQLYTTFIIHTTKSVKGFARNFFDDGEGTRTPNLLVPITLILRLKKQGMNRDFLNPSYQWKLLRRG